MSFFGTPSGLHMIIGGTGSGKSMFMSKATGFAIAMTERVVVGNLPVKWGSASVIMEKKYGWTGNLESRFSEVDDVTCLRKFWLHRGFGWVVPDIEKKEWDLGLTTDFTYAYRYNPLPAGEGVLPRECLCRQHRTQIYRMFQDGLLERELVAKLPAVQYCIDECGNVFPQLSKQLIGQSLVYYLSQKRKVGYQGDDIVTSAQCPTMVDKTFRDLSNDWLFLTNWGQRRMGLFRGPKKSTWQLFSPMPRSEHDKPMCSGFFSIEGDEGWGGFYDTAAGVGIQGGLQADKNARPKGLHWSWAFVGLALLICLAWASPKVFRAGIAKVVGLRSQMTGENDPKPGAGAPDPGGGLRQQLQNFMPGPVEAVPVPPEPEAEKQERPVRTITGVIPSSDRKVLQIYWTDGDSTSSADKEFGGIERRNGLIHSVKWAGERYVIGAAGYKMSTAQTD